MSVYLDENLIEAAKNKNVDDLIYLIESGADVNAVDENNLTSLHYASERGLHYAVAVTNNNENTEIAKELIIAKSLIQGGADINIQDNNGSTPLIFAASRGSNEIVNELINAGANLNTQNIYGETALMKAAHNGLIKIVKKLIDAGADVNAKDDNCFTALLLAARENHTEIVKEIINAGADITLKNKYAETALDIAIENDHHDIADLIQRHAAYLKIQKEALIQPQSSHHARAL